MRSLICLFVLLLSASIVMAQGGDSVVQYRSMEAALTKQSKQTPEKKYYEYVPIGMRQGDIVFVKYSSKDYVVALAVQDSSGHMNMKEDKPMMFETLGSSLDMTFKAEKTGTYVLVFFGKEPEKTGKFKVEILYYNAANDKVSNSSSFCEKLKYITGMAYTNFEFLKGPEKKTFMGKNYSAKVMLLPDATNEVYDNIGSYYRCVYPSTTDLDAMTKKYDELESQIRSCLGNHTRKEYTVETVASFEKKDFVRKVEYTLKGTHPHDQNSTHGLSQMMDHVVLKLQKSGADKYQLKLEIE